MVVFAIQLLQLVASALGVYYNSTGQSKCFDAGLSADPDLGEQGWDYQARVVGSAVVFVSNTICVECFISTATSLLRTMQHLQACTEMIMPMCSDGVHDMFPVNPWNITAYGEMCLANYGVKIQPYTIEAQYGGKDISEHSNIIFRSVCVSLI